MSDSVVVQEKVDEVRLFTLYVLFGGDARRAAIVANVEPKYVESLAHDFHWKDKICGRGALDTEEGKEKERVLNRVANYVAADRLSRVYNRLIDELDSDPSFAKAFCTVTNEDQETSFSTKNLTELSKGLEILANIKYRALGDKEAKQAEVTGQQSPAELALSVYQQLANRFDRIAVLDTSREVKRAVTDAPTELERPAASS